MLFTIHKCLFFTHQVIQDYCLSFAGAHFIDICYFIVISRDIFLLRATMQVTKPPSLSWKCRAGTWYNTSHILAISAAHIQLWWLALQCSSYHRSLIPFSIERHQSSISSGSLWQILTISEAFMQWVRLFRSLLSLYYYAFIFKYSASKAVIYDSEPALIIDASSRYLIFKAALIIAMAFTFSSRPFSMPSQISIISYT